MDDETQKKLMEEAAHLTHLMREKIIPLFPEHYRLVIMARTDKEGADLFVSNESPDPDNVRKLVKALRRNLRAAAEIEKQEAQGMMEEVPDLSLYTWRPGDGTVN